MAKVTCARTCLDTRDSARYLEHLAAAAASLEGKVMYRHKGVFIDRVKQLELDALSACSYTMPQCPLTTCEELLIIVSFNHADAADTNDTSGSGGAARLCRDVLALQPLLEPMIDLRFALNDRPWSAVWGGG